MKSTTRVRKGFILVERDRAAHRNGAVAEQPVREPSYRLAAEAPHDERHALAAFCFEPPDSFIGSYVQRLVSALALRGTPVHVFARHDFQATDDVIVHAVGECEGADLPAQVDEFTRRAVNAFMREFPNGRPVTLMGYEWSAAAVLSLLHGIKELPTIQSLHSLERQRSDLGSEIARKIDEIEQRALRESRTVLFHDPAAAEIAKYWVPEVADRIVNARSAFPASQFESKLDAGAVKARYQIGPVDPMIVCVGDLSEPYGQDLLVKAMPPILKNHPQARLVVVGEGSLYWPLRVFARYLLLEYAIRLPGNVEGQALAELMAAADVVVVPSRVQTPWWPVLAGWAAGRPVVATHPAAPGLLENERDGVLCYPSENSIVWGVERVLFDAELRGRLAQTGPDKLEERFGWNIVAEQVQEIMGAAARV